MRDGRDKANWVYVTHILITLANIHRDPKNPPLTFEEQYPYRTKKPARFSVEDFEGSGPGDIELAKELWLRLCNQK